MAVQEKNIEQIPEVNAAYSETDQCKRQCKCRRVQKSEGYYYSPTVGWICRRGQDRRQEDKDNS